MRQLMSGLLAVGAIALVATHHHEHRVKIEQIKPGGEVGRSEIHVSGRLGGRYDTVSKTYPVWVRVGQPQLPNNPIGDEPAKIWLDGKFVGERDISTAWTNLKYDVPYRGIPSKDVANVRHRAIDLCNSSLDKRQGAELQEFLKEGGEYYFPRRLEAKVELVWLVSTGELSLHSDLERKTFVDTFPYSVYVVCKPLGGITPVAKLPDIVASVALRAAPSGEVTVGNQICPQAVRLYGTVETSQATKLKAMMRGRNYLTPPEQLAFATAGSRSLVETHKISWSSKTNQIASGPSKATPYRQRLNYSFHVAKNDGTPLKQASTSITVTCKIKEPVRTLRRITN